MFLCKSFFTTEFAEITEGGIGEGHHRVKKTVCYDWVLWPGGPGVGTGVVGSAMNLEAMKDESQEKVAGEGDCLTVSIPGF